MSNQTTTTTTSGGTGVLGLLGVAFVVLKLCHVINWSWWWVLLPFWGGFALALAVGLLFLVAYLLVGVADEIKLSKKKKKLKK